MVRYRDEGEVWVADSVWEYVCAIKVLKSIGTAQLTHVRDMNDQFVQKLSKCPIIAFGDWVAFSATHEISPYIIDEQPLIQTKLDVEEDCVYVNYDTIISAYKKSDRHYVLESVQQLLCVTLCLPRIIPKNKFQRMVECIRIHYGDIARKQCDSSRIIMDLFYYHGVDMTCLKNLEAPPILQCCHSGSR